MITSSELTKVENPFRGNRSRTSYYIEVRFEIDEGYVRIPMKVDTGAAYTIVGTNMDSIRDYKKEIMTKGESRRKAYDASNTELNLYAYDVRNFRLTKDIIFPKLQIHFSEELGKRAVLGMDMLSLFNFSYRLDNRGSNGVFAIHNYQTTMEKLLKSNLYKEYGYIRPDMVLLLDDELV